MQKHMAMNLCGCQLSFASRLVRTLKIHFPVLVERWRLGLTKSTGNGHSTATHREHSSAFSGETATLQSQNCASSIAQIASTMAATSTQAVASTSQRVASRGVQRPYPNAGIANTGRRELEEDEYEVQGLWKR